MRHEQEKAFMGTLRRVGCTTGEYVGDGRGEADAMAECAPPLMVDNGPVDADLSSEHQYAEGDEDDAGDKCVVDDTHPLLILFDCETTGLSIYADHITDIAAKVVDPPTELSAPTFSSLVRTRRTISIKRN